MGEQEGHGGVYVRTQGSSQRRYTGIEKHDTKILWALISLLKLEATKCMDNMLFFVYIFLDRQEGRIFNKM